MKKIIIGLLILSSASAFPGKATNMDSRWVCTTNASSTKQTTDKAADEIMAKTPGNAVSAFSFAAKNCRDCTRITCKVK
mgnify:CR=1 FL=1